VPPLRKTPYRTRLNRPMSMPPNVETAHRYTVDVILHGVEPYPCVICGKWRQDPVHQQAPQNADPEAHTVTAEPIVKMDGGTIGYRFVCSCGRRGNGRHATEAKAIKRGHDHAR
jgi:hypothetical protein